MKQLVLLGLLGLSSAAFSHAAAITVLNFSFKEPNTQTFQSGVPTGWTGSGSGNPALSGVVRVTPPTAFNSVPDGNQVAAISSGYSFSQTVIPTVVAGTTYTLRVDLGYPDSSNPNQEGGPNPNQLAGFLPGLALLGIGDSFITATGGTTTLGNWTTYIATYIATAGDAGKSISIRLSVGSAEVGYAFDNVRLDTTPASEPPPSDNAVPEPSTFALVASAVLAASIRKLRN
jgi:hypothetical protein